MLSESIPFRSGTLYGWITIQQRVSEVYPSNGNSRVLLHLSPFQVIPREFEGTQLRRNK